MSKTDTENPTAETVTEKRLALAELRQFTGSENFYRHALNRSVLYTEGAQYLAERAGAYWLLDELALSARYEAAVMSEPFQAWTLTVRPDHTATLTCKDGSYKTLFTKELSFTDFPLPEITLWSIQNEFGKGHYTIMLASEY